MDVVDIYARYPSNWKAFNAGGLYSTNNDTLIMTSDPNQPLTLAFQGILPSRPPLVTLLHIVPQEQQSK